MRIIFTARDVGAAKQNLAFAKSCIEHKLDFECIALTEGPARAVFDSSAFINYAFDLKSKIKNNSTSNIVEQKIGEFSPDFVIVGLSYSGEGIDELVRHICIEKKIPCGVLQDYWGYLGRFSVEELPDYFFVIDEQAKYLTEKKTKNTANCIVTGSVKHEAYSRMFTEWDSNKPLSYNENTSIVFIGQPSEITGILTNFEILVDVVGEIEGSIKLFFKPHPADYDFIELYEKVLVKQNINYEILAREVDVEPVLCQADIIVTCFSTSGFDHNHLQYYADRPLGNLIYLIVGSEIQGFIEKIVGVAAIPSAVDGMGAVCKSKRELRVALNRCINGDDLGYRESVLQCLSLKQSPARFIYNYIQSVI